MHCGPFQLPHLAKVLTVLRSSPASHMRRQDLRSRPWRELTAEFRLISTCSKPPMPAASAPVWTPVGESTGAHQSSVDRRTRRPAIKAILFFVMPYDCRREGVPLSVHGARGVSPALAHFSLLRSTMRPPTNALLLRAHWPL